MIRFAFLFAVLAALPARAETTVFAAASLRGVLEDILSEPQARIAYGGSGAIARQVAAGAPADVVVLAHPDWMAWLLTRTPRRGDAAVVVARNRLVLIAPVSATVTPDWTEMLGQGRLAMGHRDAVPAGRYGQQWLTQIGVWDDVEARLAETDNVRAALALVANGAAPLGIVYASDAAAEARVQIVLEIPQDSHDTIQYLAKSLTKQGAAAVATLTAPEARDIFVRYGFGAP